MKILLPVIALLSLTACKTSLNEAPEANITLPVSDPFENLVRLDFPEDVRTVHHAATYLLTKTGYKIEWECTECSYSNFLKNKPISPLAKRPHRVTTLRSALVMIVGSEGKIIINRDSKSVNLTLLRHSELVRKVS